MNRLFEIIRKLLIALNFILLSFLGGFFIILGYNQSDSAGIIIGIICLFLSFLIYKLINWIFK